jgi:hypothetical protein
MLTIAGWVIGIAVIAYGVWRYLAVGNVPSLLISVAVVIVGPLEEVLKRWVRRGPKAPAEPAVELVDQAPSVAFLILLLVVLYLLP